MATIPTLEIFKNAGDAVCAVDADQRIIFWNASAVDMLGFAAEDVIGQKCWRVFAGRDLMGCRLCCDYCAIFAKCLKRERIGSFDLATAKRDGQRVIINVSTLLVPHEVGAEHENRSCVVHLMRWAGPSSANEGLHGRLLGTTIITRPDGTLVQGSMWRRAKVRALLAYLLLNRGQRIPGEFLSSSFWPDRPRNLAHHNLNTTIYYLRRSLEPDLERGHDSRFVAYENGHFIFKNELSHWLDIERFEDILARARNEDDLQQAVIFYDEAFSIYNGDFQADVKSDWSWHRSERVRLRTLYAASLMELALIHEQLRQDVEAVEAYSKLLSFRPWDENACLRLMHLLLRQGQPDAAILQFDRLSRALLEEMAAQPDSRILRLYDQARSSI